MATVRANIQTRMSCCGPATLVSVQVTLRTEDATWCRRPPCRSASRQFRVRGKRQPRHRHARQSARLLGEETVIESGLSDSDVVVTDGHLLLVNGCG